MLGRKVFYLNFKDNKVCDGIIIEAHISTGGYESYILQTEQGDVQVEKAICYSSQEKAEQYLLKKKPLSDKMNNLARKTTAKIDAMRLRLLGNPNLKHLARK